VGYTITPWASFGEALAAVAGALTGLLFVSLSVNSGALAASGSLRARATQTPGPVRDLCPGRGLARGSSACGSPGCGAASGGRGLGHMPAHLGPASWSR